MAAPHGSMAIPLKGSGGAQGYERRTGVYVPQSQGAQADDAPGRILAQAFAASGAADPLQAAAGLGRALEGAVRQGVGAVEHYQAARAQEAYNLYEAEGLRLKAELEQLMGKNALGEDGVAARLSRWREEARERLAGDLSPWASEMFGRQATRLDARADVWALEKEYRENIAFQDSVSQGAMVNAASEALEDPANDAGFMRALGRMRAEWQRIGQRNGWDEAFTAEKYRAACEKLTDQRLEALLNQDDFATARHVLKMGGAARVEGMAPDVEGLLRKAARKHGVDEELALAVAMQESGGRQEAVSGAGARGVMQLMPETARELGVNPLDAAQNIEGGVRYLKRMLAEFGNVEDALSAYNWGPGNMRKWIAGGRSGDRPSETREYARRVLARQGPGPGARGQWEARLASREKAAQADLRASLGMQIDDFRAACLDGRKYAGEIDPAKVRVAFGDKAERILDELGQLGGLADDIARMHESDDETIAGLLRAGESVGEGYARVRGIHAKKEQAAREILEARRKDPTGYILARNPEILELYRKMRLEPTAENVRAYLVGLRGASGKLKLGDVPIFARGAAEGLAFTIMESEQPELVLNRWQEAFGRDWNAALKELSGKDGLPLAAQLAANGMKQGPARLLLLAAREKDFVAKSLAMHKAAFAQADLEAEVIRKMAEFNATLLSGGESGLAIRLNEAVGMLALQYVNRGQNYLEAVERAAREVITDRYSIRSVNGAKFRVPKSLPGKEIEKGAAMALEKVAAEPVWLGDNPFRSRESSARVLRKQGQWVTNGDDSGLVLCVGGVAVRDEKGRLISRSFEELAKLGQKGKSWMTSIELAQPDETDWEE